MLRPLMQQGIGQLEEMFTKCKADAKLLKQLEHELQYRHVPRAVSLLTEAQAVMCGMEAASPPAPPTAPISRQPELWGRPAIPPVVFTPAPVRTVAPADKPLEPQPKANLIASPPTMPMEEAYKILKATPGATWEPIEQTRCTLVHQSHPSRWKALSAEKRAEVLANAKRVNAAYAALSQTRCGGR